MSWDRLPPYGIFPAKYSDFLPEDPMPDWRPDLPAAERRANFETWRAGVLDVLAASVWPRFDRPTQTWSGAAEARSLELTRFELEVMVKALQGASPALDKFPTSPNMIVSPRQNRDYFEIEDDVEKPIAAHLAEYDVSLSPGELAAAEHVAKDAFSTKVPGVFWLKGEFQRPRPWQTAMMLQVNPFRYEHAKTAVHSACYSGHCLESITFCAAIYVSWLKGGRPLPDGRRASLARFAADYGDRRVMAGVHYPSDNIASWYIAVKLLPHLFPGHEAGVVDFVREVVRTSTIHSLILENYASQAACAGVMKALADVFAESAASAKTTSGA